MATLREHRRAQLEERLAVGPGYRDRGLVFATPEGDPLHPESVAKVFDRRVARASVPRIRFHDLRHSHATHLIHAGEHAKAISERLGHASVAFTLDTYGHLLPSLGGEAVNRAAAAVFGS